MLKYHSKVPQKPFEGIQNWILAKYHYLERFYHNLQV